MHSFKNLVSFLALATIAVHAKPVADGILSAAPPTSTLKDEDVPVQGGLLERDAHNALPTSTSAPATFKNCYYVVDGVGKFNSRMHVSASNWTKANFDTTTKNGAYFKKWNWDAGAGYYDESRVVIGDLKNLQLRQYTGPAKPYTQSGRTWNTYPSAQISTNWSDILYGSVRTVARGDVNPGAVYGFFFYATDVKEGETDIEIRTVDPVSFYITNQNATESAKISEDWYIDTTSTGTGFSDYFHEYRLD
ncbi:hypothetical protein MBLNU459_g3886t1 [Dothideomycetes sp. NU459]